MGVKQGCVLAPTIFNIFLSTVTLLSHKLLDPSDGVQTGWQPIQYSVPPSLHQNHHPTHLGAAVCRRLCSPRPLSRILTASAKCGCLHLQINIKKTQKVVQESTPQTRVPTFTLDDHPLAIIPNFTYLGSILSPSCGIDDNIQVCIGLVSAAFGRLGSRVFRNRGLTISTKAAVYKAVWLSTLLYGSETWTPYQRHIRTLEAFHICWGSKKVL